MKGSATNPAAIPTAEPAKPVHVPCSARVRRIIVGVAPFADSCPIVTSWLRALVANAAATMMPTATSASTPATQPQAIPRPTLLS